MNELNYTSEKLSKWLHENGCKLESFYWWRVFPDGTSKFIRGAYYTKGEVDAHKGVPEFYPAYDILNDICVKYAKEFWGNKSSSFGDHPIIMLERWTALFSVGCLLEKGLKQEAEDYIMEHCKFNKDKND